MTQYFKTKFIGQDHICTFNKNGEVKGVAKVTFQENKLILDFISIGGSQEVFNNLYVFLKEKAPDGIVYIRRDSVVILPMLILNHIQENELLAFIDIQ